MNSFTRSIDLLQREMDVTSLRYQVTANNLANSEVPNFKRTEVNFESELKNAIDSGRVAQAYMLTGIRGIGKTTSARIIARALNCIGPDGKGGMTTEPCGVCEHCRAIAEDRHIDVIEMNAASTRGIDNIREIIETTKYNPTSARYKIYIIDEVHMMTTNAFNALLKTLEEPPAHVIFILATTEPHNIIPTILSRCQRYDFTKVSDGDIEERMMTILEKEGVEYDKDAVRAIISLADGGMRDALSILDQILAYSGNQLSVTDVYNVFGIISVKEKLDFIADINMGEISRTLERIKSFSESGVDIKRLTQDVLEILKDALIYKKTKSDEQLSVLNEKDASELATSIELAKLHQMIGAFLKLQLDFKTASNIRTLFEVSVLKLLTYEEPKVVAKPIEQPKPIIKPVEKPAEPQHVEEKPVEKPVIFEQPKVEEAPIEKAPDWLFDDDTEKKVVEVEGERYELEDSTIIKCMVAGDKLQRQALVARWDELNSYLGHPTLGDIVAVLKDGTPFIVTQSAVVLQYDFEKLASKANVKTNADRMADILKKMLGHDVFVYAVSRSEGVRLTTAYQNLRQINKLPMPGESKLSVEELRK